MELCSYELRHHLLTGFIGFGFVMGTALLLGSFCNIYAYCTAGSSKGSGGTTPSMATAPPNKPMNPAKKRECPLAKRPKPKQAKHK